MKLSIVSYAFHGLYKEGKIDVFGYLESMRYRYHIYTADLWNGMFTGMEEEEFKMIRAAMDEKEIALVNLCVDHAHIWDPDAEVRRRNRENALKFLRAAVILGARTVRIDMGGTSADMSEEQVECIVNGYQEYTAFARDNGFLVGPENHFGPALIPQNLLRLREAVASTAFGILLHVGHWDSGADVGDEQIAPWAMHTHVDMRMCEGDTAGKIQKLLNAGYQGYWGVEHHSGRNEYVEVEWQLATVRRALSRIDWGGLA